MQPNANAKIMTGYFLFASALCSGKPVFTLESNMGIQNLIMNCSLCTCDFMYIIL